MTTTDQVMAVIAEGERVSWDELERRLVAAGGDVVDLRRAVDSRRLRRTWFDGSPYSFLHDYERRDRGTLYVERAPG